MYMSSGIELYLVAYAPSSPHRLMDMAKLAFSMSMVKAFVAIKPTGIAAQTGVPEVFRLAYKLDKRFLVFPRIQDVKELINIDDALFLVHQGDVQDVCSAVGQLGKRVALVVQSGETPFTKEDLSMGRPVRISELDGYSSPNPVAEAAIALFKLYSALYKGVC